MRSDTTGYIAHISDIDGQEQTVLQHNIETAQIAMELGESCNLINCCYITGLYHDVGKGRQFNDYIHDVHKIGKTSKRGTIDHSTAGAKYIMEQYCDENNSKIQVLTAMLIATAIMTHHGEIDIVDEEGKNVFRGRLEKDESIDYTDIIEKIQSDYPSNDNLNERMKFAIEEVKQILQTIAKYCTQSAESATLQYQNQMFARGLVKRLLSSLLIDADRINTYEFMRKQTHRRVLVQEDIWDELCETFEKRLLNISGKNTLGLLRNQISKECYDFAEQSEGIYQLPCPTGAGKTLAGMRFALNHARMNKKKRIFYIAPFRTVLEQNASVIRKSIGREDIVLEHHSSVIPESEEVYSCLTDSWEVPVVLTTMVQFLNTLFEGRTQCIRRFHSLCNSVIIIDEVQAIPVNTVHMFNQAMNFLANCFHTTIVLCTATMPILDKVKRPILFSKGNMITGIDEQFEAFKRVNVTWEDRQGGYTYDQFSQFIFEKTGLAKSILVIMNTKEAANEVYQKVKEHMEEKGDKHEIILLTTNLCAAHRMEQIERIQESLMHISLEAQTLICISTQLVEAGVDLSFEMVIRSLAGLDSIAQAAGRCNRNMELEYGTVSILPCCEEKLGRLKEIQEGQNATRLVLRAYVEDPKMFDCNLLSPKALDLYYKHYYFRRKEDMDYPVNGDTLFCLLSDNKTNISRQITQEKNEMNALLPQAFKKAGTLFEVIGSNTVGVIVPYKDGKRIINLLNGNCEIGDIKRLLREAQLYTVNMYSGAQFRLIESHAIFELQKGGILAINEGYYSEEYGITKEQQLNALFE